MLKIKQQIKNVRTNILYEVYGVNPKSKTYHVKIIGLPNQKEEFDYLGHTYKIGQKYNVGFRNYEVMGYYTLVPEKQKPKKIFITTSKTAAISLAKQGLKLNDKTLKLKNVFTYVLPFKCEGKGYSHNALQVMVIADTNMQAGARMEVGICKQHTNCISTNYYKDKKNGR